MAPCQRAAPLSGAGVLGCVAGLFLFVTLLPVAAVAVAGALAYAARRDAPAASTAATRDDKASICPNQRLRTRCKECGGASICPHQRQWSLCKECVPNRISFRLTDMKFLEIVIKSLSVH